MSFHPAVAAWFERRFSHGPTEPQAAGWPAIAAGQNTLIAAPTGSGKTLAAFLVCIDRLYRAAPGEAARQSSSPVRSGSAVSLTRVVYVSPLKALANDIQQNLEAPLAEIAEVARELGLRAPEHARRGAHAATRRPGARGDARSGRPHILITTPESLYLMLTAEQQPRDAARRARR